MRRHSRSRLRGLLISLFLCCLVPVAGATPKNLPDMVIHARSLFIENETGFVELEYTAVLELSKWGHFEIANSREKADLVMRLDNANHVRALPEGNFQAETPLPTAIFPRGIRALHCWTRRATPSSGPIPTRRKAEK